MNMQGYESYALHVADMYISDDEWPGHRSLVVVCQGCALPCHACTNPLRAKGRPGIPYELLCQYVSDHSDSGLALVVTGAEPLCSGTAALTSFLTRHTVRGYDGLRLDTCGLYEDYLKASMRPLASYVTLWRILVQGPRDVLYGLMPDADREYSGYAYTERLDAALDDIQRLARDRTPDHASVECVTRLEPYNGTADVLVRTRDEYIKPHGLLGRWFLEPGDGWKGDAVELAELASACGARLRPGKGQEQEQKQETEQEQKGE